MNYNKLNGISIIICGLTLAIEAILLALVNKPLPVTMLVATFGALSKHASDIE